PRSRDELQRRRLRLRRSSGQEGHRGDEGTRRRQLRLLGRPRRLHDFLQYGPEKGTRSPREVLSPGRRLQEEDRFWWSIPDRAEAEGADEASVRLRLRRGGGVPAQLLADRLVQAERRDEPRDARRS